MASIAEMLGVSVSTVFNRASADWTSFELPSFRGTRVLADIRSSFEIATPTPEDPSWWLAQRGFSTSASMLWLLRGNRRLPPTRSVGQHPLLLRLRALYTQKSLREIADFNVPKSAPAGDPQRSGKPECIRALWESAAYTALANLEVLKEV